MHDIADLCINKCGLSSVANYVCELINLDVYYLYSRGHFRKTDLLLPRNNGSRLPAQGRGCGPDAQGLRVRVTPSVTTMARRGSQPDDGACMTGEGGLPTRGGPSHASACCAWMEKRNQTREGEEEGAHLTLATTAGTVRCSDEGMGDVGASSRRKPDTALAAV